MKLTLTQMIAGRLICQSILLSTITQAHGTVALARDRNPL